MRRAVGITCLVLAVAGHAADSVWPVKFASAAEPSFHDVAGAIRELPAAYRDDAIACVLYSRSTMTLEADGTIVTTAQEITRLNTRKGIDALGQHKSITFTPAYETLTIHRLAVHKSSGEQRLLQPGDVQLRDVNTDHLVYDPSKVLIVSFPGLEPGDAIEAHWTTRGKHPEHAGQLFTRYGFGDEKYPTLRDEFRVRLPAGQALKYARINNAPAVRESREGNQSVWSWTAERVAGLPKLDHAPPKEERRPAVAVSTFASWEAVRDWERNLSRDCQSCDTALTNLARKIRAESPSALVAAQRLTALVRHQVRYVSTGETHDYTPHSPTSVWQNRYGDCKDTAHLLASLLRAADIDAGVASLGTRGDGGILEAVPSPWGNHAICAAKIDGQRHWIDTTASHAGWDVLPEDDRDRLCAVTAPSGLTLERTPAGEPADQRTTITTRLTIAADGNASGTRRIVGTGLAAAKLREEHAGSPPSERKQALGTTLRDALSKAVLKSAEFDPTFAELDRPAVISLTFDVPEFVAGERAKREGQLSCGELWSSFLSTSAEPDRPEALELGAPFEVIHRFTLVVAPGLRFTDVPNEGRWSSEWGNFSRRVVTNDSGTAELEIEFRFRLTRGRVGVDEIAAFTKWQDDVHAAYRVAFAIVPTRRIEDAPVLEKLFRDHPNDLATAQTLAEIYITAERDDDARRVLDAAREALPNEVSLWRLSVGVAEDEAAERALLAQMAKRFPDESEFVLAWADALMDAGEYDAVRTALAKVRQQKRDPASRGKALALLARVSLVQKQPKEAGKLLMQAEKAHPALREQADFLTLKGRILNANGDRDGAAVAWSAASEADAELAEPLLLLAALHRTEERPKEALAALSAVRSRVADDPKNMARAALEYARLGRAADAVELANASESEGELTADAKRALGLAYAVQGKPTQAIEQFNGLESDTESNTALMEAYLRVGNFRKAVELGESLKASAECAALSRFAAKYSTAHNASSLCVEYLLRRGGTLVEVEPLIASAFTREPDGWAFGARAWQRLLQGQWSRALADAETAIHRDASCGRAYLVRGKVRAERGQAEGLVDLQKAAELLEEAPVTLRFRAEALDALGRTAEARAALTTAAKRYPDDTAIRERVREWGP